MCFLLHAGLARDSSISLVVLGDACWTALSPEKQKYKVSLPWQQEENHGRAFLTAQVEGMVTSSSLVDSKE